MDEITLSFRTLQRNGLLLHTGRSADYVNLSLRNGALWLVINLGSGAFEALVEPTSGKFNDNNWHDVRVTRNRRQVGPPVSFCCWNGNQNQSVGLLYWEESSSTSLDKGRGASRTWLSWRGVFFWAAALLGCVS